MEPPTCDTLVRYGIDQQMVDSCYAEAEDGLKCGEVPVGCVFVWAKDDNMNHCQVIAKAHNRTNELKCGSKHAEMECLAQVMKRFGCEEASAVLTNTTVLVSLEPCIMCCRMLRKLRVRAVLYGAANDRFGGAGSVFPVHSHSAISDSTLCCVAALDPNRAINLLQLFYEQVNQNTSTNSIGTKNK